ncbi:MAG: hypothetical protein JWQ40_208 [Segetibacter sp.]|nr:hypothetical protein [Segetibacter sp.]
MNVREEILKEHSLQHALKIAGYPCSSAENFDELMKCFLCNEYRVAQRSASSVAHCGKRNSALLKPYIKDLVAQLSGKDVHNAVIRNSVRILQDLEIPEEHHGEIINVCFGFIENPATPIAIKALSVTRLANMCKLYPEIKQALKVIIEDRMDFETPAFKSRAKKILTGVERENKQKGVKN